jgi:MFS family permease
MHPTIATLARVPLLRSVFLLNFILSLHYFLVVYINSSFVSAFFSKEKMGFLFTLGSVGALLAFLLAPLIIKKQGLHRFFLASIVVEAIAVAGMLSGKSAVGVLPFFLLHLVIVPFLPYCLDIFLEGAWKKEGDTGLLRGLHLTLTNIALIGSPLLLALILRDGTEFGGVYLLSLLLLIPAFFLSSARIKEKFHSSVHLVRKETLKRAILSHNDTAFAITAHFVLQFFYAWMVIYTPLYLSTVIGFDWSEIGLIFTIMLIPFAVFEIPVGEAADRWWGEKELMTIGFVIMAGSVFWIPFIKETSFLFWTLVLLATRIGASIVEITTESYFFKQIDEDDTDLISLFRMTRPLSLIVAPLVATFALTILSLSFGSSFFILSVIVALGVVASLSIKDSL